VVQSLEWINGALYAVINNSQKIVVLDPQTFQQTGQINLPAGASPREIVKVGDEKAYVTDLYANALYIINLSDFSVSEKLIQVGLNPDKIMFYQGFAYVANNGFGADSSIYKIDVSTDFVVDTIIVNRGPAAMVVGTGGMMWVVAQGYAGNYDEFWNLIPGTSKPGGIHGINIVTGEQSVYQELPQAGDDIGLNEESSQLYINAGGIRAFDLNTLILSDTVITGSFYAFSYEPESGQFFTANARDYASAGEIRVFNSNYTQENAFNAGIIPGSFLFIYNDMLNTSSEFTDQIYAFTLSQNYPNPFNPSTTIQFTLQKSAAIQLEVFSLNGIKIATLADGRYSDGVHSVRFDGSPFSTGVYFYKLDVEGRSSIKKMILIK
jgi:hypothetical protein